MSDIGIFFLPVPTFTRRFSGIRFVISIISATSIRHDPSLFFAIKLYAFYTYFPLF